MQKVKNFQSKGEIPTGISNQSTAVMLLIRTLFFATEIDLYVFYVYHQEVVVKSIGLSFQSARSIYIDLLSSTVRIFTLMLDELNQCLCLCILATLNGATAVCAVLVGGLSCDWRMAGSGGWRAKSIIGFFQCNSKFIPTTGGDTSRRRLAVWHLI